MFWVKWLTRIEETHETGGRTRELVGKIMNAVAENGRASRESLRNSTEALKVAETMLAELRATQSMMAQQVQGFMFTVGLMAVRAYEADGVTPAMRLMLEKAVTALERTQAAAPLSDTDGELLERLRRLAQPQEPTPPAVPASEEPKTGPDPADQK